MAFISWAQMPTFEIYSDQLISIVNQELAFLKIEVTNSMINNYVKQKLMPLPIKKKYQQEHIACLIMISLLKSAFSMDEIKLYFQSHPVASEYDAFCRLFEMLWQNTSSDFPPKSEMPANPLNYLLAMTIVSKFRATQLFMQKGENHETITAK